MVVHNLAQGAIVLLCNSKGCPKVRLDTERTRVEEGRKRLKTHPRPKSKSKKKNRESALGRRYKPVVVLKCSSEGAKRNGRSQWGSNPQSPDS